jgi:hypothetical protein
VACSGCGDDTIALFETTFDGDEVLIVRERHYRLVEFKAIQAKDLAMYRTENPD